MAETSYADEDGKWSVPTLSSVTRCAKVFCDAVPDVEGSVFRPSVTLAFGASVGLDTGPADRRGGRGVAVMSPFSCTVKHRILLGAVRKTDEWSTMCLSSTETLLLLGR